MKNIVRSLMAATLVVGLFAVTSAFAGECCVKAAAAAKQGKTCSHCETKACCKATVEKLEKDNKAKACAKCAAPEKKGKS
ncbi:MAG: hypothetical protein HZA89_07185 [Verrucomicrobia bacterium]|nr:hypothetical protein [Verrucomicrobiota bacterium]